MDTVAFFSMRTIDDLKRQWKEYDVSLSQWQDKLTSRINELEENVFQANSIKLTWQKTEKEARKQNVLKESLERIRSIIDRTKKLKKILKTDRIRFFYIKLRSPTIISG